MGIRVLCATNNDVGIDDWIAQLPDVVVEADDRVYYRERVLTRAQEAKYDVVALLLTLPGTMPMLDLIRELREKMGLRVILLGGEHVDPALISQSISLGVYDFVYGEYIDLPKLAGLLFKPATLADVAHLRIEGQDAPAPVTLPTPEPTPAPEPVTIVKKETVEKIVRVTTRQEVFTVWSPAGGAGTTTTALCIAKTLGEAGLNTLLIDFNLVAPAINIFLDMEAGALEKAFEKAAIDSLSVDVLQNFVVRMGDYNALLGLGDPNNFEKLSVSGLEAIVDQARRVYDAVVIDTHSNPWVDATYVALRKATRLVVPMLNEYAALAALERYRFILRNNIDVAAEIGIVLNRYDSHLCNRAAVESALNPLGFKVVAVIPDSKNIRAAMHRSTVPNKLPELAEMRKYLSSFIPVRGGRRFGFGKSHRFGFGQVHS
jgi:cellulose biosynthesis protein BcsQ